MNAPETLFIDCLNYLHGRMSIAEQRGFQARLRADSSVRRMLVDVAHEEMLISEVAAAPESMGRFSTAVHSRRCWLYAGLAAAAALMVFSGLCVIRSGLNASKLQVAQAVPATAPDVPRLQMIQITGEVLAGANERQMALAKVGDMLAPGTLVLTGARDSECTLQLGEQAVQINLDAESSLVWKGGAGASEDGLTVELLSGKVASSVDPEKGVKYTVRTEAGFARAVGTHFTVTLTRTGTTGEKRMKNRTIMMTKVTTGIVLVGSLSGFTNLVHAGDADVIQTGDAGIVAVSSADNVYTDAGKGTDAVMGMLHAIIIPDFTCTNMPVAEVIQRLNVLAKDSAGVTITIADTDKSKGAKVSMTAKQIPLDSALDVVARSVELEVAVVADNSVVLRKAGNAKHVATFTNMIGEPTRTGIIDVSTPDRMTGVSTQTGGKQDTNAPEQK